MNEIPFPEHLLSLPKAELHLHLEGGIRPAIVSALTARHGVPVSEEEVRRRYSYTDFLGFLDTFKWVTSFLRNAQDYALIVQDLAEQLLVQNVVYAEVTLSVGVMLLRNQRDRKSTRLNSSHGYISYAVFCLKKKKSAIGHRPAPKMERSRS